MGRERTNARPPNAAPRDKKDYYPTPMWCVDGLVHALKRSECLRRDQWPVELVVDIGSGDGRIGSAVACGCVDLYGWEMPELVTVEPEPPVGVQASYIGTFQDYLREPGLRLPWIGSRTLFVSNPPFSQSHEIVELTVRMLHETAREGSMAFFLLRMDWRASLTVALGLWESHPPAVEFPLSPRPSFVVSELGSTTDFYNYAWHGWAKQTPRVRDRWSWPVVGPHRPRKKKA